MSHEQDETTEFYRNTPDVRIKRPKHAEIREWITFVASIVAPVMIAWGSVYIKNQRLEIKAEADKEYVGKLDYATDKASIKSEQSKQWEALQQTNAKLDDLKTSMVQVKDSLEFQQRAMSDLKDAINRKSKPSTGP